MTQKVGLGGTIPLDMIATDGADQLTDPSNLAVDIIDANNVQVATDIGPIRDSLGRYHIVYTVSNAGPVGVWTAHWTGDINGLPVENDDLFQVVPAGQLSFEDTNRVDYLRWLLDDRAIAGMKNFFQDTDIQMLLDVQRGSVYRAALDGWSMRAAYYHKMIDLQGSIRRGSNPEYQRPYSQLYIHAKSQMEYFLRVARELPADPDQAIKHPVVGESINLRETGPRGRPLPARPGTQWW